MKKIALWLVALIVAAILSAMSYLKFALPSVGSAPDMKIEATHEKIARGEYLANHVTVCIDCHSKRDWTRFSGPPIEGTFGQGGEVFNQKYGFPGSYHAVNITPEGIGNYTDGELYRAITTGVNKEGKALFPVMPYHYYGQMDPEDIKCIIAYIRTLKPIKNDVPKSESDFPMNFIINTIPQKAHFSTLPPKTDSVNYGKYLTNAAACIECHTRFENGGLVAGSEFGGGREFPLPDGSILLSHNITPDKETGIGKWSAERFIHTFRERSDSATMHTTLKQGDFNTVMPWIMYGKMTEEDLKAIFVYLQTVKPIRNKVELFAQSKK